MQLIRVSEKVLINPDMITSVEQRVNGKENRLIVRADGKDYIISNAKEFFDELIKSNVEFNEQFTRL